MRMCPKCLLEKDESQFYINIPRCKQCRSIYIKQRRLDNLEMYKLYVRNDYKKHKEKRLQASKLRREKDKEKYKQRATQYRLNNIDKLKIKRHEYYLKKKNDIHFQNMRKKAYKAHSRTAKFKQTKQLYLKTRRANDTDFKLRTQIGNRIRNAISRNSKKFLSKELIGCSYSQLRVHLEFKFSDNMSWNNYGEWHIDHIIPCNYFDLSQLGNQKICFNYRNLRPLWARDNLLKGDKLPENHESLLKSIKQELEIE